MNLLLILELSLKALTFKWKLRYCVIFSQYGLTNPAYKLALKIFDLKEQCNLKPNTVTALHTIRHVLVVSPTKQMEATSNYAYRILRS